MVKIDYDMIKNLTIIMITFFYITSAFCQLDSELDFILRNNPIVQSKGCQRPSIDLKETSESKLMVLGMIRFYQLFISSQQNNARVCTFTPGCSDFSMAAINKYGIFYGMLMTSDRIQRCHNYKRSFYPIHPATGKRYDPIESYYRKIMFK